MFLGGVGWTQPIGNTYHYLTPSYGLQFGGGRQWSNKFALPIQFDFDHFGFNGRTITNQSYLYFGEEGQGLDGSSHTWSFTVDPTYTFYSGDAVGAYVVAGVGFYHKVADFFVPEVVEGCEGYYCGDFEENETLQEFTSNAPGFNGGFGLTYKFSHFSNERFYGEVRYVFIDNSQRYGYTAANANTTTYNGWDFYPANSNRTTYVPVKFGLRF